MVAHRLVKYILFQPDCHRRTSGPSGFDVPVSCLFSGGMSLNQRIGYTDRMRVWSPFSDATQPFRAALATVLLVCAQAVCAVEPVDFQRDVLPIFEKRSEERRVGKECRSR